MHLQLPQNRPKGKVLIAIATSTILVATPLAAKAFDLGFLTDMLNVVDQVLGIDSGQWWQAGIDAVNQISGSFSGNFDLNSLLSELLKEIQGAMGLPDPTEIGTTDSGNSQRNEAVGIPREIKYPEQAYLKHSREDNLTSAQVQSYVAGVLDRNGQQQMADRLKQSGSYAASAQGGLQETVKQSQQAATSAQDAETAAATAKTANEKAQGETESQAVLKDISAINAQIAANGASHAAQLSSLSNQASIQSGQLSAIAGTTAISNQLLTDLKIGQTYQTMEMTNTSQAIRQMNEDSRNERRGISNTTVDSIDLYYVPSLTPYSGKSKALGEL